MTTGTAIEKDKTIHCRLHYKKTTLPIELPALNEIFSNLKSASILGGNPAKATADRFSYWMAEPVEVFEFRSGQKKPFKKLHRILTKYKLENPAINCGAKYLAPKFIWGLPKGMFCGGWVGYFSYELGRYIEKLPETTIDDLEMPIIRLCFYDHVIAYDHITRNFWLFAIELENDKEKADEKIATIEEYLSQAAKINVSLPPCGDIEKVDFSQIRCNMDKNYYLNMFKKIKRYIFDGDVYQINFSQRFKCDFYGRSIKLFHWQNHYNPSGYSAYINWDDFSIVSASPEMFITVTDGFIKTKPIKGTRRRLNESDYNNSEAKEFNARNFNELLQSEKEKAELNMIIDLERNDVAKICQPGTRKVIQQRTIDTYPTVFHAVATIGGKLRSDINFCDIMKAMFPGGSITGAPKIRSMEIIDETEPTARGVYTGSIGFIGVDGSACLNIAIRTIIIAGQKAFAQTGGGIVADSEPEAEWQETITKARALIAGIKATQTHKQRLYEG